MILVFVLKPNPQNCETCADPMADHRLFWSSLSASTQQVARVAKGTENDFSIYCRNAGKN
jgi:hypothetical protein